MQYELLIVDDEKSIADILCETFEDEGVKVHALYSGNEAIDFVRNNSVKLILSDIQMPNGTGIDLIDALSKMNNAPQIFFMTGYTEYSKEELTKKVH